MKFSKEEIAFVKSSAKKGVRVDLRNPLEKRETRVEFIDNPQADGSLLVTRGHTKVVVSAQYKETGEGLLELKLVKSLDEYKDRAFDVERLPSEIKRRLENWLEEYKIGLRIDLEIINDDGNIYEAFIYGLREIFSDVEVPDINDLEKTIKTGLDLPLVNVLAFFGPLVVLDPTLLEEESCDFCITSIEEENRIKNLWTNKCGEIELEDLKMIIFEDDKR